MLNDLIADGKRRTYAFLSTHHYKLMYGGQASITAKGFHAAAMECKALELIAFTLEYGDVVEIYDGFTPYFFYFKTYQTFQPAQFAPPVEEAPEKPLREKGKA
jgi:hypothetical protein